MGSHVHSWHFPYPTPPNFQRPLGREGPGHALEGPPLPLREPLCGGEGRLTPGRLPGSLLARYLGGYEAGLWGGFMGFSSRVDVRVGIVGPNSKPACNLLAS